MSRQYSLSSAGRLLQESLFPELIAAIETKSPVEVTQEFVISPAIVPDPDDSTEMTFSRSSTYPSGSWTAFSLEAGASCVAGVFLNVHPQNTVVAKMRLKKSAYCFFMGTGGYCWDENIRMPEVCMRGLYSRTNGAFSAVFRSPGTLTASSA